MIVINKATKIKILDLGVFKIVNFLQMNEVGQIKINILH